MAKKVLCLLVVLVLSFSMVAEAVIFVDIQEVVTDTPPQIINDRTMVPVRAIVEMIGYDVYWYAENRQVEVCEQGETIPKIIMQIDNPVAYCSKYAKELGEEVSAEVILDSPPTIINDRTFVPLRFISEAVGYVVEYIPETGDVYLFSPEYIENHQGEDKGGEPGGTGDDSKGGLGLSEDGKGEDAEGVNADEKGDVVPLSMEEMTYVLYQTTESWLAMSDDEKSALVVLIGRWWEDYKNIIVEDYEEMVLMIDHQMEQYHKNQVNVNLFETVCDIYGVDKTMFVTE